MVGADPSDAAAPLSFNLGDLFGLVARAVPGREAVVCDGVRRSFAELDERSDRLAAALVAAGIRPGDRVGVHLPNRPEFIESFLAACKARAAPVNVHPRYVASELAHVFADAGLAALVTEPESAAEVAAAGPPPLVIETGDRYEAALAAADVAQVPTRRSGDDRYVLYTGGTTGRPKGVEWRQEDVFFAAMGGGDPGGSPIERPEQLVDRIAGAHRRLLPASPLAHGSAHWMAMSALLAGACVVLSPDRHLDAVALLRLVAAESVTFLVIVGDAFARPLLDALDADPSLAVPTLTVVLSGGAALSPAVRADFARLLPTVLVVDGYGASETGGLGQLALVPGLDAGALRFRVGPDTEILGDDLRPLPRGSGTVGLLARRGRIPLGYLGDDEADARTFPVVDGERWAVPGDLATLDADGTVTLLGRRDAWINTGGEKVDPGEVEHVLREHPDVEGVVVVGVPDERWGERVTAVVAPASRPPTLEALDTHCRGRLADYKVPRKLVVVPAIARTAAGKADLAWAREVAARA